MAAVRFLVRTDLRRHWRRVVGLSLLVAIVGGVTIAAVLGADRSRTSLDRFVEATNVADVIVFVDDETQLDGLDQIADVEQMSRYSVLGLVPEQVFGRDDVFLPFFAPHDDVGLDMNGYRVIDGRRPGVDAPDELVLHEATADLLGVTVGDHLTMLGLTADDMVELFDTMGHLEAPSGPTIDMEVVGLVRDPADVVNRAGDMAATILTPAVYERYHDEVGSMGEGALFTMAPDGDIASFTSQVRERSPDAQVERWIGGTSVAETGFGSTLEVIGNGLLLLGAVIALSGAVAIWQAFGRASLDGRRRDAMLSSLGLDRRRRAVARLVPGVVVALVGAAGAGPVALVLSARFPIGVARRAEPDPGIDPDARILLGMAAVALVVTGLAVGSSLWTARRVRRRAARRSTGGSSVLGAGARVVASDGGALVASTRAAVAFGGLAVAAALVFSASMTHLQSTPRLYGWGFDTAVSSNDFDRPSLRGDAVLADDPAVSEVDRGGVPARPRGRGPAGLRLGHRFGCRRHRAGGGERTRATAVRRGGDRPRDAACHPQVDRRRRHDRRRRGSGVDAHRGPGGPAGQRRRRPGG